MHGSRSRHNESRRRRGTTRAVVIPGLLVFCVQATPACVGPNPVYLGPVIESETRTSTGGSSTTEVSTTSPTTISTEPTTSDVTGGVCGDGVVDAGEECDEGGDNGVGACTDACLENVCGDLYMGPGESCDDGNQLDGDGCTADCVLESCGNGVVDGGEECDDGNDDPTDACTDACLAPACGDGIPQLGNGEECDDGDADNTDDCTTSCLNAACGDGYVQGDEPCDDGNDGNNDACLVGCTPAICGDGFKWDGVEECDDGNANNQDSCTQFCEWPSCDDDLLSGDETDIDCGGPECESCDPGQMCEADADCAESYCVAGVCELPDTCEEILNYEPQAQSGLYLIEGQGQIEDFYVVCDMDTDSGGWMVVWATDGLDNREPLVSDEIVEGEPLAFLPYNLTREQKVLISERTEQGLFHRPMGKWLRVSAPLFTGELVQPNGEDHVQVGLYSNDGQQANGWIGFSTHSIAGGGDYNITQSDAPTCGGPTMFGLDHDSTLYWHTNCDCERHYLYSRSDVVADGDGSYNVRVELGEWTMTKICDPGENTGMPLYAAMR